MMLSSRSSLLFLLPIVQLALVASNASAAVTQPDGTVMPLEGPANEVSLQEMFDFKEGEGVMDVVEDATTEPSTFRPLCDFTAQLLLHEAGSDSGVGWYNVPADDVGPTALCDEDTMENSDGDPCSASDIFLIIPPDVTEPPFGEANDPLNNPGQIFSGSDIANHPFYAGGDVGFVLLTQQRHYSETRLNPTCTGSTCIAGDHWIPTIIYASKTQSQTYYMCSEDQVVGPEEWGGNDGDFNDYVIQFTGLVCSGSGEPCDTGEPGICAAGLTDCADANGDRECRQARQPEDEECNAIDDDCDGEIDDGDLCPQGEVCDRGRCKPVCLSGEFPCAAGLVCSPGGACIDPACLDKECPTGEVCEAGKCVNACTGVVCPHGQTCLDGACVDPCAGIECDEGLICQGGACLVACGCQACDEGVCDEASGRCVDDGCVDKDCPAGSHCSAGECVDDCDGAVCPGGGECVDGVCGEPITGAGGGAGGGDSEPDGGVVVNPGSGGASASSGGTTSSGGTDPVGGGDAEDDSGCGCRTPGSSGGGRGELVLGLLAVALAFARRRRSI